MSRGAGWLGAAAAWLLLAAANASAAPAPFGVLRCEPTNGVRFCPGDGNSNRIASWDGVPLDVDVTLPAAGRGPWPTIVMQEGWPDDKTELELGGVNATPHYNNVFLAQHGFLVVNFTARGLGKSCGGGGMPLALLQLSGPCARGFVRVDDQRYEARDTQYLLGRLVDERLAAPAGLGVTGISYGAGRAVELAYLRNRIRCAGSYDAFPGDPCDGRPQDSFVRWRSPRGTPLQIAAAWPRWPFSDLPDALVPNGRFLDYDPATDSADGHTGSASPIGVPVESVDATLYAQGLSAAYYERPGPLGDPAWDITADLAALTGGQLLPGTVQRVVDEWAAHHQGFGIPGAPAPMLLESGWDDDFFPPEQSLRVYNDARRRSRRAFVALQLGDLGHPRGSNKPRVTAYDDQQGLAFLKAKLTHRRGGPAPGSVSAFTQTCPSTSPGAPPDGGPYRARTWAALHPGIVVLNSRQARQVAPDSGNPILGTLFDPVAQALGTHTQGACTTVARQTASGTATYSLRSAGFTLMGLPTVVADVSLSGLRLDPGQLDARLWDLSPGGLQLLVTRGIYRFSSQAPSQIVFQLHGGGFRFAPGDTVELELLGADAPYYRPSIGGPTIEVHDLRMVLPTLERPNSHQIDSPASQPLPSPGERGPRTSQGRLLGGS